MRRIHVVALVALSSSGTESFVLLAGRGARRATRPATATTLSSEERFAEELQGLPSAVDQLRAIDANGAGLGPTAPFAVVLAPAAASDASCASSPPPTELGVQNSSNNFVGITRPAGRRAPQQ